MSLSLPSRSDTRYTQCIDIVYIHIESALRLIQVYIVLISKDDDAFFLLLL
jgi:hypothetical protein